MAIYNVTLAIEDSTSNSSSKIIGGEIIRKNNSRKQDTLEDISSVSTAVKATISTIPISSMNKSAPKIHTI